MLDEIGADESEYAAGTSRFRRWIVNWRDYFTTVNTVRAAFGRDYGYSVDRARFDAALCRTAAASPGVIVEQGASVTDMLCSGACVSGVRAHQRS
jgi:flavin-dependent dehydrogenase